MHKQHALVTASQTDANGYQTLVSLVTMMQDCSQAGLETETAMNEYFKEHNLTLMIASRQVDVLRYPVYGEQLEIITSIYECKSAMGYRNTVINDAEGKAVAQSWSVGAVVSLDKGKLSRIPRHIVESLTLGPKLQMDYLGRRIPLPSSEPRTLPAYTAQRSDIDFNQHVNNVQYIRLACDQLPEDFTCKRLRVEYKNQAKQGDVIIPRIHEAQDGVICVQLCKEGESPYAIIEFTE